jgi:predicted DNA-binding transcriptional regulator AlpA
MTEPRLNRVFRRSELKQYVGLGRTQVDELIKKGEFPPAVPLSDGGRAVAWLETDLIAWQHSRIALCNSARGDVAAAAPHRDGIAAPDRAAPTGAEAEAVATDAAAARNRPVRAASSAVASPNKIAGAA